MRRTVPLLLFAAVMAAPAAAQPQGRVSEPVVVELFTAQGCSGCPEANELVMELAQEPGVIALTYPVDYWDYLGWRDTFAKPEFTQRQRAYQAAMQLRDVYTPQIVVDGRRQMAGVQRDEVEETVREEAARRLYPPDMMFMDERRVAVGSGRVPRGGAEVWLVRYEQGPQEVEVRRGENRGVTVRHGNLVRELVRLGEWRGRPRVFRMPSPGAEDLQTVVLVQAVADGAIIAAEKL